MISKSISIPVPTAHLLLLMFMSVIPGIRIYSCGVSCQVSAWTTLTTTTTTTTNTAARSNWLGRNYYHPSTSYQLVRRCINQNNHHHFYFRRLAHIDSSSVNGKSTSTSSLLHGSSSSSSSRQASVPFLSQQQVENKHTLSMSTKSDIVTVVDNDTQQQEEEEEEKLLQVAIDSLCNDDSITIKTFGGIEYIDTYNVQQKKYRVLFVLGGPGAGKGTQSELMVENYPVEHYSVGQLLRDELVGQVDDTDDTDDTDVNSSNTETIARIERRKIIQSTLDSGKIVPVEISLQLLYDAMKRSTLDQSLVLVDGFPRNYDNLYGWCHQMKNVTQLQAVLVYQCPLTVLEQRIMQRSVQCPGRSDDNIIALQKRFTTFEQQTIPVTNILREAAAVVASSSSSSSSCAKPPPYEVIDIQGDRSIDDVWETTQQILNKFIINDVLSANAALLHAIETNDSKEYQKLCDPLWFRENDPKTVLLQQEQTSMSTSSSSSSSSSLLQSQQQQHIPIQNAQVDVISGKHVAVQYDRYYIDNNNNGIWINEKRIWSHHGPAGWQLVHFLRTPSSSVSVSVSSSSVSASVAGSN